MKAYPVLLYNWGTKWPWGVSGITFGVTYRQQIRSSFLTGTVIVSACLPHLRHKIVPRVPRNPAHYADSNTLIVLEGDGLPSWCHVSFPYNKTTCSIKASGSLPSGRSSGTTSVDSWNWRHSRHSWKLLTAHFVLFRVTLAQNPWNTLHFLLS